MGVLGPACIVTQEPTDAVLVAGGRLPVLQRHRVRAVVRSVVVRAQRRQGETGRVLAPTVVDGTCQIVDGDVDSPVLRVGLVARQGTVLVDDDLPHVELGLTGDLVAGRLQTLCERFPARREVIESVNRPADGLEVVGTVPVGVGVRVSCTDRDDTGPHLLDEVGAVDTRLHTPLGPVRPTVDVPVAPPVRVTVGDEDDLVVAVLLVGVVHRPEAVLPVRPGLKSPELVVPDASRDLIEPLVNVERLGIVPPGFPARGGLGEGERRDLCTSSPQILEKPVRPVDRIAKRFRLPAVLDGGRRVQHECDPRPGRVAGPGPLHGRVRQRLRGSTEGLLLDVTVGPRRAVDPAPLKDRGVTGDVGRRPVLSPLVAGPGDRVGVVRTRYVVGLLDEVPLPEVRERHNDVTGSLVASDTAGPVSVHTLARPVGDRLILVTVRGPQFKADALREPRILGRRSVIDPGLPPRSIRERPRRDPNRRRICRGTTPRVTVLGRNGPLPGAARRIVPGGKSGDVRVTLLIRNGVPNRLRRARGSVPLSIRRRCCACSEGGSEPHSKGGLQDPAQGSVPRWPDIHPSPAVCSPRHSVNLPSEKQPSASDTRRNATDIRKAAWIQI